MRCESGVRNGFELQFFTRSGGREGRSSSAATRMLGPSESTGNHVEHDNDRLRGQDIHHHTVKIPPRTIRQSLFLPYPYRLSFLTWLCVVWMVTDEVSWTDRMVRPVRFEENRLPDGKSNFAAYSFDNRSKDLYELGNVFLFLPPTQKRNIHSFSWLKFFRKNWIGHISILNYTALVTCIMCKCLNVVLYMMLCMKKICASNSTCEA